MFYIHNIELEDRLAQILHFLTTGREEDARRLAQEFFGDAGGEYLAVARYITRLVALNRTFRSLLLVSALLIGISLMIFSTVALVHVPPIARLVLTILILIVPLLPIMRLGSIWEEKASIEKILARYGITRDAVRRILVLARQAYYLHRQETGQ